MIGQKGAYAIIPIRVLPLLHQATLTLLPCRLSRIAFLPFGFSKRGRRISHSNHQRYCLLYHRSNLKPTAISSIARVCKGRGDRASSSSKVASRQSRSITELRVRVLSVHHRCLGTSSAPRRHVNDMQSTLKAPKPWSDCHRYTSWTLDSSVFRRVAYVLRGDRVSCDLATFPT